MAYNLLAGGSCIEDLGQRRSDDAFLDMLGVDRIPDPTTAGDFCRRFRSKTDIDALQDAVNESRLRVWQRQPASFFDEAIVDADGTIAETTGERKEHRASGSACRRACERTLQPGAHDRRTEIRRERAAHAARRPDVEPAYSVIATLAWNLSRWIGLVLPVHGRWRSRHADEKQQILRMRLRTLVQRLMLLPAQVVRSGRRLVVRLLDWNPWRSTFFRALKSVQLAT